MKQSLIALTSMACAVLLLSTSAHGVPLRWDERSAYEAVNRAGIQHDLQELELAVTANQREVALTALQQRLQALPQDSVAQDYLRLHAIGLLPVDSQQPQAIRDWIAAQSHYQSTVIVQRREHGAGRIEALWPVAKAAEDWLQRHQDHRAERAGIDALRAARSCTIPFELTPELAVTIEKGWTSAAARACGEDWHADLRIAAVIRDDHTQFAALLLTQTEAHKRAWLSYAVHRLDPTAMSAVAERFNAAKRFDLTRQLTAAWPVARQAQYWQALWQSQVTPSAALRATLLGLTEPVWQEFQSLAKRTSKQSSGGANLAELAELRAELAGRSGVSP